MGRNLLAMLKLLVMVATLLLATLGILYVLEFFTDAELRDWVEKTLKIVAIMVASSVVIILLYGSRR